MFISDKPFANFWTNCSSCPGLQPRIDDGPAAVPSCTAHSPTCSVLAPSYYARHSAWSEHGFESSEMSCLRAKTAQVPVCPSRFFRDIHLWRQRRVTIRGPLGKARPSREDAAIHFVMPRMRYCRRLHIFFVGHLRQKGQNRIWSLFSRSLARQQVQYTVPPGLRAGAIDSNIQGLPASVLARGQSHRVLHTPPIIHPSIHPILCHPCRPRFPPRLAGLLT